MANDNETVEQVLERMTRWMGRDCSVECQLLESDVVEYADRILTAHNREIDAIAAQKTAEAHEAFVKNAELAEAIAARDAEIEKLKFDNLHLKSCQRQSGEVIIEQTNKVEAKDAEIEDLKKENASLRVIVSGATVADGNLREEIERLREIVKELADELETMICNEIVKSSKRHGK